MIELVNIVESCSSASRSLPGMRARGYAGDGFWRMVLLSFAAVMAPSLEEEIGITTWVGN